ncbi:pPIWI_RE module domain-containing protein [Paenibacillus terrae]|uniref:DUF3893 domain-containing protein n=1 Tax=Paenibacillus terrae TaxID=159743 RepID=A0A0D7WUR5_9BACL|nr:DUF3962 domain-containing protein [Paenibacillus terrae]KJD42905.1 hypothetical protein QD47_25590 [Paenibacillus terrae]
MNRMELFALEVNEKVFYHEMIHVMHMPVSWRNFFNTQTTAQNYKLSYKVEPLGKKLKSIFPEIVYADLSYKILQKDLPWIVSTVKISEAHIKKLTLNWFAHLKGYTVAELPEEIKDAEPRWVTSSFGEIYDSIDKYQWLPGLAAHKFCEESRIIELGQDIVEELQFHHTIFNNQHECISTPIRKSPRHDPYSYVMKVELKNRGGDAERSLIVVSVGTRRYLKDAQINKEKNTCYLKADHACSVLVSVRNPYMLHEKRSFSQLKFERRAGGGSQTSSFAVWKTALDGLYWDVLYGESFEPDMLLAHPAAYLDGAGEVTAYVVNHNSFNGKGNFVKFGLGLAEKRGLFNKFKEVLAAYHLTPLFHIPEIPRKRMNDIRFPIIAHQAKRIIIEVFSSESMFNAMKEVYTTEQKSLENSPIIFNRQISENVFGLNSDRNVTVEFVHRSPEGIVSELEIGTYKADVAHTKLVNQINKKLTSSGTHGDKLVVALVEINEKESWSKGGDPKHAIREGMKKARRLTQFIQPLIDDVKADTARMINALLDLLSDAGFLSHNITKLDTFGRILSYNVLKSDNKYLPVISKLDGTEVTVKIFGVDSWIALAEAPFSLEQAKMLERPKKGNQSEQIFKAFMIKAIEEELDQDLGQLIVIINATLRNGWLPAIRNTDLQYDAVPYLSGRLKNDPRLKFIRINTRDDIPQYRIIENDDEDKYNKASGIFKDPLGIYYGVGGRPRAWSGVRNEDTKFLSPSKMLLQQKAVEYIPLGALGETERDDLANLADQLRRIGLTYDKHTIYPYTLRVMSMLSKYLTGEENDYDPEFDEEVEMLDETKELV